MAVSRHDARKGLDVLIHALAGLRDAGVGFRACLVGTGVLLHAHRGLVERLRLGDRVALPGRVPEVMPYLRHSDIYVLPSTEEGSGSVATLEALQAGDCGRLVGRRRDGRGPDRRVDALLVAPGSAADLQRVLAMLVGDEALRRRLGSAGRALYERRFAPAAAVAELAALYTELGPAAHLSAADRDGNALDVGLGQRRSRRQVEAGPPSRSATGWRCPRLSRR